MNVYRELKIEVPTISYLIFHQSREGIARENYQKTMRDFHQYVQSEARKLDSEYHLSWTCFIQSVECYFRKDVSIDPVLNPLIENGKQMLKNIGFNPEGTGTDIYSSSFIFKSALYLDIIEHLVRDRLGIYGSIHGRHIGEFAQYGYTLQNLVYESSGNPQKDRIGWELSLFFSKPKIKYEPFRLVLSEALDELESMFEFPSTLIWQRKLGLGVGNEFELRVNLPAETRPVDLFLHALRDRVKDELIQHQIFSLGNLLIKEKLW
jgi:hypothetical protein